MAGNLYEQGYYETGTASVTQGQTVVTGQGTAWSQIVRPADDFGKHVGMPIPIASVDSDTQITLAYPWPGPTQAAAPYRVTFTPYHVAYRQALQEIGQLLSSGNVSALAGLVGGANKLPFFDGTGTMDQTVLSAFMRTLLDDANASEAVATLAPGFGWGANNTNVGVPGDNLNTLRTNGVWRVTAGTVGAPPISGVAQVIHAGQAADYAVQVAYGISSLAFNQTSLKRVMSAGVWSDWISLQGARGSNANGEYVRYADGTQICWKTDATFVRAASSLANYSWTFPATFSSIPAGIPMCSRSITAADYTGDITFQSVGSMTVSTGGTTTAFFGYSRIDSAPLWASGSILNCRIGMIGRWF